MVFWVARLVLDRMHRQGRPTAELLRTVHRRPLSTRMEARLAVYIHEHF